MWDLIVSVPDYCLFFYNGVKRLDGPHNLIHLLCSTSYV